MRGQVMAARALVQAFRSLTGDGAVGMPVMGARREMSGLHLHLSLREGLQNEQRKRGDAIQHTRQYETRAVREVVHQHPTEYR